MATVARFEDVSVSFGRRPVLTDLSLEIARGRATVLVGPSGSGKTTLLRCLNRLNELHEGHAFRGRLDLTLEGRTFNAYAKGVDVTALRRRVAMVFQAPNVLPASIRRNMALPLRLVLGARGGEAEDRIEAALRRAGLWAEVADRLEESALTLSGGQQQRLCIARALALEPELLLLDEPTASLDFRATAHIEALIDDLKTEYTVVAVSHELAQASRLADRVVVLEGGRLRARFDADAVRDPAAFRARIETLL